MFKSVTWCHYVAIILFGTISHVSAIIIFVKEKFVQTVWDMFHIVFAVANISKL